MRVLGGALAAALFFAALLSSSPGVSAARVPAPLADQTSRSSWRGASSSPADEQPRKPVGENAAAAAAASSGARLDASSWKKAAAAGAGSSSPTSTVFDPDRMSKRRVRRGSDPIHNKC